MSTPTKKFVKTANEIRDFGPVSLFSRDPASIARRLSLDALIASADSEAAEAGINLARTPGCQPSIATIRLAAIDAE